MIDLIHTYWRSFLWSDDGQPSGMVVTLFLLFASSIGGFLASVPLAFARLSGNRWLRYSAGTYVYLFRTTPLYVQLLIIYSGIYGMHFVRSSPALGSFFRNPWNCVLLSLVLNECAYMTEILVGSIRASQRGEIEAARAFGLPKWKVNLFIVLPAALRRALPTYSNEVIFMLHGTTLAFTATIPDIMKIARDVNAATYATFESFGIASLLYLCISCVVILAFKASERRWLKHLRPRERSKLGTSFELVANGTPT